MGEVLSWYLYSHDSIERGIGLAVTSTTETMAASSTRGGRNQKCSIRFGKCRFRVNSFSVHSKDIEHLGGGIDTNTKDLTQLRSTCDVNRSKNST